MARPSVPRTGYASPSAGLHGGSTGTRPWSSCTRPPCSAGIVRDFACSGREVVTRTATTPGEHLCPHAPDGAGEYDVRVGTYCQRPALEAGAAGVPAHGTQRYRKAPASGTRETRVIAALDDLCASPCPGVCAAGSWGRTMRRSVPSWAKGLPTICQPEFVNFLPHLHDRLMMNPACVIAGALTQHRHENTQQLVTDSA